MITPTRDDRRWLARLTKLAAVASLVPESRWRDAVTRLDGARGETSRRRKLAGFLETVATIERALGYALPPEGARALAEDVHYRNQEDVLCILKDHLPGGWQPALRVQGAEHVSEALRRGRGAVLWVAYQRNRLAWKKGLCQAGISATHLSRTEHGFSSSEFGVRFLNPICTRIECRYLEGRAVFDTRAEGRAIRQLHRKLKHNGVVSVQDGGRSDNPLELPFLNGFRRFHPGAPSIAFSAGAVLLPLFTVRRAAGDFEVVIGAPIDPPAAASRREAVRDMTERFARQLETYFTADPAQWTWGSWSAAPQSAVPYSGATG